MFNCEICKLTERAECVTKAIEEMKKEYNIGTCISPFKVIASCDMYKGNCNPRPQITYPK